jgi:hypothetical protein
LLRLKQFDDVSNVRSTTKLGDWYGNLIRMGNRRVLMFISERSRLDDESFTISGGLPSET